LRNPLKRKKSMYEKQLDPETLNTNPMVKEGQLGAVIALPLLGFLFGIIFYAKNYAITQEEFTLFSVVGLVVWMVGLIGYYGYALGQAAHFKLFDREFGYSERLHPRCEIYCKPEDIRLLIKPEDKIQDFADLKLKIEQLGFDKGTTEAVCKQLEDMGTQPAKYLYYFQHKDSFEGWNAQEHVIPRFKSHTVFTNEVFDKQFGFSAGQENWYGPILYNHPSAESDNVKVLCWTLDPFTHDPMPICYLIHCSKRYVLPEQKDTEYKQVDAQGRVIAMLYGLNQSLRRQNEHVTELKDANFAGQKNIVDLAHDAAKADIDLYQIAMKAMPRGWMRSGVFKGLVTIVSIIAVAFIIVYVLNWLGYVHVFT